MIPIGLKMADDELMTTWLQSMAEANGMEQKEFFRSYLGAHAARSFSLYPKRLEQNCQRHADMAFFPDVFTALEKHTDLFVAALGLSRGMAAHLVEVMLRDASLTLKSGRITDGFRYCPECIAEDQKAYGRKVVHVPHQIAGVKCCWKHGCSLENNDGRKIIDTVTGIEQRIAAYARELYLVPPADGMDQIRTAMQVYLLEHKMDIRDLAGAAVADGYLDDTDKKTVVEAYQNPKRRQLKQVVRLLAYLYPDERKLRRLAGTPAHYPENTEEWELADARHCIGRYRCKRCGREFYRHERAVEAGMVCPHCQNGLTREEQLQRLLSRYRDGQYEFTDESCKRLRHKSCGNEMPARHMFWLYEGGSCWYCGARSIEEWQDVFSDSGFTVEDVSSGSNGRRLMLSCRKCGKRFDIMSHSNYMRRGVKTVVCPGCEGPGQNAAYLKKMRMERLGQRQVAGTGIGAVVAAYDGWNRVLVRFDNGLERWMNWDVFLNIGRCHKGGYSMKELHIGEEGIMKDGGHCVIIRYQNRDDLLVQFDDGVQAAGNYKKFQWGTIVHP